MKQKNINLVLILLFMYAGKLASQVPGYMGRRLIAGYSTYVSPALVSPTAQHASPGVNITHCFNLEYVIRNRTMVCVGYQMLNTGTEKTDGYGYLDATPYGYYDFQTATYRPDNRLPMQLKGRNISFGFKFFRRGVLAPAGAYQKLEMIVMSNNVTYQKNGFYPQGSLTSRLTLGTGDYDFKNVAFALTLGREHVFFDRVAVDAGLRFGIMPGVVLGKMGDFLFDTSSNSYNTQIQQNANWRLQGTQLINFHIGIGFLAF